LKRKQKKETETEKDSETEKDTKTNADTQQDKEVQKDQENPLASEIGENQVETKNSLFDNIDDTNSVDKKKRRGNIQSGTKDN